MKKFFKMSKVCEKVGYSNPEGSAIWEYIAAISCASLIFGFGCSCGWTSPGLTILMGPDAGGISSTDSQLSFIVTLFAVGYGLAPILTIVMADKFGRKNSLLAISIPLTISWGLIAVAKDITVLSIARFISGLSSGLGLCLVPMYLGEIASTKLRGAWGMGIGMIMNAGILFVYSVVPYVSLNTSGYILLAICTLSMISIWFIPESPYFLTIIGKLDEAEYALEKLRGKPDVAEEFDLIKRTVSHESERGEEDEEEKKSCGLKQLITVAGNRRAFYILLVFVFVLLSGSYGAMMQFGHVIFKAMRSGLSTNACATIVAIIQLVSNIFATLVVEKFGRKPLICISGVISGFCLLIVSVYFWLLEYTSMDVTLYSLIPIGAIFLNTAALNGGLLPLLMVTQSEILATEVKALVTCLIGVMSGVCATIMSEFYPRVTITWDLGHTVPFFAFFISTWTGTMFIMKFLPETKGKTFLDIQKDLNA